MEILAWLRELGLERYEQAFREDEIAADILPKLTADDLKDMGRHHRRAPPQAPGSDRQRGRARFGAASGTETMRFFGFSLGLVSEPY